MNFGAVAVISSYSPAFASNTYSTGVASLVLAIFPWIAAPRGTVGKPVVSLLPVCVADKVWFCAAVVAGRFGADDDAVADEAVGMKSTSGSPA